MSRRTLLSGVVLGLGMALSTATQLRLSGVPVGIGEGILVAWCIASIAAVPRKWPLDIPPALRPFAAFWALSLALLLAGWGAATWLGRVGPADVRDFFAYCLVAAVVSLVAIKPGGLDELRIAWRVAIVTCTVALFALLIVAVSAVTFGPLELWHRARFRGWSENPNQVGVALSAVPFLLLYQIVGERGWLSRFGRVLLIFATLILGVSTDSGGLVLAWGAGLGALVVHTWFLAFRRARSSGPRAIAVCVAVPLLALAVVIADGRIPARAGSIVYSIYSGESQGLERLEFWQSAVSAVAASPLVGLGPGAHVHAGKHSWLRGVAEAHNIYLDWATATGILGSILLLWLLVHVARSAREDPPLLAALVTIAVLGLAHHFLRHPIIWMFLLAIAGEGRRRTRTPVG